MKLDPYGEVWVCTDCYFANHYGAHEIKPEDADEYNPAGWYAGESDTPCDCEPLKNIHPDFILFDATCPEHETEKIYTSDDPDADWDGEWTFCPHCGSNEGWDGRGGTGIQEFSWTYCGGCSSHLGGSRYRLTMFKEVTDAQMR